MAKKIMVKEIQSKPMDKSIPLIDDKEFDDTLRELQDELSGLVKQDQVVSNNAKISSSIAQPRNDDSKAKIVKKQVKNNLDNEKEISRILKTAAPFSKSKEQVTKNQTNVMKPIQQKPKQKNDDILEFQAESRKSKQTQRNEAFDAWVIILPLLIFGMALVYYLLAMSGKGINISNDYLDGLTANPGIGVGSDVEKLTVICRDDNCFIKNLRTCSSARLSTSAKDRLGYPSIVEIYEVLGNAIDSNSCQVRTIIVKHPDIEKVSKWMVCDVQKDSNNIFQDANNCQGPLYDLIKRS